MAEVLGPMQIVQQALPTGVDGTKVAEWRLRDGTTFREFAQRMALALGAFNASLMAKWGFILNLTDQQVLEYPDGGSVTEMQEITDVDRIDMVHGQTIGHMIELKPYGLALGGSWRYFRDSREPQILSTIRTGVRRADWRFERKVLTRALTDTENAIGSAGFDVPFVDGGGGSVPFTPPAFGGEAFDSSHDHRVANATGFDELFNDMAETLQEHGHMAPFEIIVSRADVQTIAAEPGFVQLVAQVVQQIDRGGASSGPQFFAQGNPEVANGGLFGFYQTDYGQANLYSSARIPTTYAFMTKSYGSNDPRNGLAVRVHPDQGFGLFIVPALSDEEAYPIKRLNIEFEFGVSVGADRTNGVLGINAASWTNPTIS